MSGQTNIGNKPTIKVYYNQNAIDKEAFEPLLHGIEEEGIPYAISGMEEDDIFNLSHEASKDSKLGVGLGINSDKIALHYEKLDRLSPLFKIELQNKNQTLRDLGANATRLVKRIPFKKI